MRVNRSGFTLIELLVVMIIIMALGTIAVITFTGAQASARDARRISDLKEYQTALELYSNGNDFYYPRHPSCSSFFCLLSPQPYDAVGLCSRLGLANCARDPKVADSWQDYKYITNALLERYVLWARLEKTDEYFVVCSNGKSGKEPVSGFSAYAANCPI